MIVAYVCADPGIPLLGGKGASVHMRAITAALAARGNEVHILCTRLGEGNAAPTVADVRQCKTDVDIDRALCELAGSSGIDVVLERYSLESGAARRTSERLALPLVLEVNAPLVLEAARWRGLEDVDRHLTRERDAFATADAVIVVSSALVRYVRATAPEATISRVPNGADVDRIAAGAVRPRELDVAGSTVIVGFAGSMKPWHGLHELLDAFASIHIDAVDSMLVLAGGGPEEPALRTRVDGDDRLRGRVRFVGSLPHDEMPALLASFDLGVAPYSASEDFYFSPLKVVEYLAAGLPVVHPRLGDLTETIGDAGIAYDPADRNGLTVALDLAQRDAALRQRCSLAAQSRAQAFTWDATAAAVEGVADAAIAKRSRAAR